MIRIVPIPERGELQMLLDNCDTRRVCAYYGIHPPTLYAWMKELDIQKPGKRPKRRNIYQLAEAAKQQRSST